MLAITVPIRNLMASSSSMQGVRDMLSEKLYRPRKRNYTAMLDLYSSKRVCGLSECLLVTGISCSRSVFRVASSSATTFLSFQYITKGQMSNWGPKSAIWPSINSYTESEDILGGPETSFLLCEVHAAILRIANFTLPPEIYARPPAASRKSHWHPNFTPRGVAKFTLPSLSAIRCELPS